MNEQALAKRMNTQSNRFFLKTTEHLSAISKEISKSLKVTKQNTCDDLMMIKSVIESEMNELEKRMQSELDRVRSAEDEEGRRTKKSERLKQETSEILETKISTIEREFEEREREGDERRRRELKEAMMLDRKSVV